MKKAMLKFYIYACYIVSLPVFLPFSIVLLVWDAISAYKDYGEWDSKNAMMTYVEGLKEGHKINMDKIDYLCSDDAGYQKGL